MHSLPKLLSLARENVVKITFCTVNKSHTAVHIVVPRRRRQRKKYMNVSFDCGGKCEMYSNYQRQNTGASEKRQNWIRGWERKSGNRRKAIKRGRQSGTQAKKLTDITRVQRARCRSEKWKDMTSRWRSEWWRRWNTRAQWQWAGALHEMTVPELCCMGELQRLHSTQVGNAVGNVNSINANQWLGENQQRHWEATVRGLITFKKGQATDWANQLSPRN